MGGWKIAGLLGAALIGGAAQAQDAIYWPASPPPTNMRMTYLPLGTPVTLRTRTQVSTKTNRPGDRVYLEVAETLYYRGQAVVPAGAVAVAEVARADRNGHFGKKGRLDVRLLYIETPNGQIRLNGASSDEGTSGLATSIATMAFVSPLGFLVHGTSAQLPVGTVVHASLGEPLAFQEQAPRAQVSAGLAKDVARPLPARFDPTWFSSQGKQTADR